MTGIGLIYLGANTSSVNIQIESSGDTIYENTGKMPPLFKNLFTDSKSDFGIEFNAKNGRIVDWDKISVKLKSRLNTVDAVNPLMYIFFKYYKINVQISVIGENNNDNDCNVGNDGNNNEEFELALGVNYIPKFASCLMDMDHMLDGLFISINIDAGKIENWKKIPDKWFWRDKSMLVKSYFQQYEIISKVCDTNSNASDEVWEVWENNEENNEEKREIDYGRKYDDVYDYNYDYNYIQKYSQSCIQDNTPNDNQDNIQDNIQDNTSDYIYDYDNYADSHEDSDNDAGDIYSQYYDGDTQDIEKYYDGEDIEKYLYG